MKKIALLFALWFATLVQAQSMYRWVDPAGKVHYGDRPPSADAREVQEKKYSAPTADKQISHALRQAMENHPVVVHSTADCGAPCQQGRDYLNKRGIPFSEKAVSTNEEIAALREQVGKEELSVPVLQVGEKFRMGFLETAWDGLLDAAGYPKAKGPGR